MVALKCWNFSACEPNFDCISDLLHFQQLAHIDGQVNDLTTMVRICVNDGGVAIVQVLGVPDHGKLLFQIPNELILCITIRLMEISHHSRFIN